jgi:hypothetical protein
MNTLNNSTQNNSTQGPINPTPILSFDNTYLNYTDITSYAGLGGNIIAGEVSTLNYCPLPPYCLIEDKHKYLAG